MIATDVEYTAEMAHKAAERGAAWLDEKCPDWVSKINTDLLDLAKPDLCILGQTANCLVGPAKLTDFTGGGYWRVMDSLRLGPFSAWQRQHGFDVPHNQFDSGPQYEMLTIAWKQLIRERLEAAS